MPALHGRRGLKQRRKGFFGYCRRKCRGHRKGLSFFANSAERGFPNPDRGSNHGDAGAPRTRGIASVAGGSSLGGCAAGRIRSWVK